jgi:hypothetical protein
MPLDESFYRDLGDGRYESTASTAGPWSAASQHGGPPSGLVGRVMERFKARPELRIARVTVEIPRPVPVGEITVVVRLVHSGRRAEILEGEIVSGDRTVLLARAWRVVRSPGDTPSLGAGQGPPPVPGPRPVAMAGVHMDGYLSAMDWRFVDGGGFDEPGPGAGWARQRIPLVAGEADTPLTRVLTLADSSWAIGAELDHVRRLVINTDVTVALHREPVGEWLYLRSVTSASPGGSGLAHGHLADTSGDCGHVLQTLLVAER